METSLKVKKLTHMEGVSSFDDSNVIYGCQDGRTVQVPKSILLADDRRNINSISDNMNDLRSSVTEYTEKNNTSMQSLSQRITDQIPRYEASWVFTGSLTQMIEAEIGGTNPDHKKYKYSFAHLGIPYYDWYAKITEGTNKGKVMQVRVPFFIYTGSGTGITDSKTARTPMVTAIAWSEEGMAWRTNSIFHGDPELIGGKARITPISSFDVLVGPYRFPGEVADTDGVHIMYKNYDSARNITNVRYMISVSAAWSLTCQSTPGFVYPFVDRDKTLDKANAGESTANEAAYTYYNNLGWVVRLI